MGSVTKLVTNTVKNITNIFKKPKVPVIQQPSYEELKKQEEEKPETPFFSDALKLRKRNKSIGLGLDGGGTTDSSGLGIPQ